MLVYSQRLGTVREFGTDKLIGSGYAGKGTGKNNPAMETTRAVGPIPRGFWRIGAPYQSSRTGPHTIPLYKLDASPGDDIDSQTGRSAFRIHGDSSINPGAASEGCIVMSRIVRETITLRTDEILWVKE